MTVLSRKSEAFLEQLIQLAGDPDIVRQALRTLNDELQRPPTAEELVERILTLKRQPLGSHV
jgi:hypothetical protein